MVFARTFCSAINFLVSLCRVVSKGLSSAISRSKSMPEPLLACSAKADTSSLRRSTGTRSWPSFSSYDTPRADKKARASSRDASFTANGTRSVVALHCAMRKNPSATMTTRLPARSFAEGERPDIRVRTSSSMLRRACTRGLHAVARVDRGESGASCRPSATYRENPYRQGSVSPRKDCAMNPAISARRARARVRRIRRAAPPTANRTPLHARSMTEPRAQRHAKTSPNQRFSSV